MSRDSISARDVTYILLPLLSGCWAREKPNEIASPFVTPLLTIVGLRRSKFNPKAAWIETDSTNTRQCRCRCSCPEWKFVWPTRCFMTKTTALTKQHSQYRHSRTISCFLTRTKLYIELVFAHHWYYLLIQIQGRLANTVIYFQTKSSVFFSRGCAVGVATLHARAQ